MANLLRGDPTDYDGRGGAASDCGDTVEIFLWLRDGKVREARFRMNGCINTALAAQATTELATGRSPVDLLQLEPEAVLDVATLPEGEEHCADTAAAALHAAARDALRTGKEPWKKLYR
jgi:NifU homolog involved in Fe-S cluster formation